MSDFDGTITTLDIGDEICRRGAPADFAEFTRRWDAGEFTLQAGQAWVWPRVRLSRPEVLSVVDEVAVFRAGFEAFFAAAARAIPFAVASNGFADYIEHVLSRLAPGSLHAIFANRFEFGGEGLRATFPMSERYGCGACGVCKAKVIQEMKAAGYRVAFIGDGSSDRHAAGHAHHTFAVRGASFERHLLETGAPYTPFDSFDEIGEALGLNPS